MSGASLGRSVGWPCLVHCCGDRVGWWEMMGFGGGQWGARTFGWWGMLCWLTSRSLFELVRDMLPSWAGDCCHGDAISNGCRARELTALPAPTPLRPSPISKAAPPAIPARTTSRNPPATPVAVCTLPCPPFRKRPMHRHTCPSKAIRGPRYSRKGTGAGGRGGACG